MKNVVFIFLLSLIQLSVFSQKVTVKVIKTENAAIAEWQILDEDYKIVFIGNDYYRSDSVILTLEANKRYFLTVSVSEIINNDINFYKLILNDEPLILLNTNMGTGDHSYPFFTGTRIEANKIVGGTNALISDFPWQIYYISGNYRCGGSIISDQWIVTAAHCTKNDFGTAIPVSTMFVKAGANNPANAAEGQIYSVSEVIVHEGYDSQTLENDIALLKLQTPINTANAKPIKLISSEDVAYGAQDPGVMTWVTGWGLTQVNPPVKPSALQKVQLPIITNAQASSVWSSIPSTCIMAGYLNGNKDACNGDSGGPMVVPVIDGYKLAGIVSWGSSNCNTYGAYTSVSKMESWIRGKTGIPKEYTPPAPVGDTLVCSGVVSSQYSVGPIDGATAYEWQISPLSAGSVTWDRGNATVTWNPVFIGQATLIMRVTVNGVVSEWSRLYLKVVLNTRLLSQSSDTAVCAAKPISLFVGAEGYNLNYKWFQDGIMKQSGTSPEIFFPSAKTSNSGIYKCQVSGYCNSLYANDINLTVYPLTKATSISPDVSVAFGNDIMLEVISEGHNLVYQWLRDGSIIDNSDSPKLFIYNLNATDIGLYYSYIKGTCGSVTSDSTYVYVNNNHDSGNPNIFLWPSVTTAEFKVALGNEEVYNINIFNTSGQIVKEIRDCQFDTIVNVGTLGKGTYIVKVYNNRFSKSLRFIKI
jgi:hypothetical protein